MCVKELENIIYLVEICVRNELVLAPHRAGAIREPDVPEHRIPSTRAFIAIPAVHTRAKRTLIV